MFEWVTVFIDFLREDFTVGGFTFSFFDVYVWVGCASLLIFAFRRIFDLDF